MSELIAGAPGFRHGDRVDFVDIRVRDDLLIIEIAGAPDTVKVLNGIQAGYDGGWIRTDMSTLVDVSGFHGKIDWSAVKRVSELAAWGGTAKKPARIVPAVLRSALCAALAADIPSALERLTGSCLILKGFR